MCERRVILTLALAAISLTACVSRPKPTAASASVESRAVEFLTREVPAWSRENGCYSCHNNGDAARALFAASRKGYRIPKKALADTVAWISSPAKWDHNKGDPGFSDQRLADVQFAASLAAALESGVVKDSQAMRFAANKVAKAQADDGSWPIDAANAVGSPATYGATLATYMAWRSLKYASSAETSVSMQKAEERLGTIKPDSVPNAAVVLLFRANFHDVIRRETSETAPSPLNGERVGVRGENVNQRRLFENPAKLSLDFLRRAQTRDGGWGPYADSPPEAFDTALALLALAEFRADGSVQEMIQRGREFLIGTQLPDGSWPATTRPSGGQSYAQQISTTGWATLALLATH